MFEFIYCWALNGEVEWSSENADTLLCRVNDEKEKSLVAEFIENSQPGNFITLKSGVLISRVNLNSYSTNEHDRLAPLFIGADYQKVSYIEKKGKGKSPRSHYRRGHWRQQACGEKWSQREWRLIQPTLVGAKN